MATTKLSYGIDFGTTNSSVAYVDENHKLVKLPLDPDADNPSVMRSVIYVSHDRQFLYGKSGIDAYIASVAVNKDAVKKTIFTGNYINIIDDNGKSATVPEIIEVDVSNSGRLLQSLKSALSRESIKEVNLYGKVYQIEEVVGLFLKELKHRSDRIVGRNIESAIVGRPVEYVGGNNRLAIDRMKKACDYAGFKDVKFEYEPVGAAYNYGVDVKKPQTVLIFDFGGGTLDISIFKFPEKKALANVGLPIGGDYFNSEIFMSKLSKYFGSEATFGTSQIKLPNYIFSALQNWYEISLLKTGSFSESLQRFRYLCSDVKSLDRLSSLVESNLGFTLYEEIERVKKDLSASSEEKYKFIAKDINIETLIKKEDFEAIIKNDLEDIRKLLLKAVDLAGLSLGDIDSVATTGGSSLIPAVVKLLNDIFGETKLQKSDAFTGVASGLALIN